MEAWKNGIAPFSWNFPGSKYPSTPSGKGYQQCPSSIFTRSVYVQRPASILNQSIAKLFGMLIVKIPQVAKEEFGDTADFAGRQRDTVFIEKSAPNLFTLAVMDKSLKSHEGHDVITYGSAWNDMLSERKSPSSNKTPRSILTPVCTNMDGFPNFKLAMT